MLITTEAAAVLPAPHVPAPLSISAQGLAEVTRRIELPVNWQMTRARFAGSETNTQTESYRETWELEISQNGEATLQSRRGRVGVYRVGAVRALEGEPEAVVLSEPDFVKLLGLKPVSTDELVYSGASTKNSNNKLITISLFHEGNKNSSDLMIKLSDDEHVNLHYEFTPVSTNPLATSLEDPANDESAASR